MAQLTMYPVSLNGNVIGQDQFGYTLKRGIGFVAEGVDSIQFRCPSKINRVCSIPLTLGPEVDRDAHGQRRWHWDGNMPAPTITPSIGCEARCGWHGNITAGAIAP